MRVLVTGAYGLIGSACLVRLHGAGHDVVAAGRSIASASLRFPYARWIETDFCRLVSAEDWMPLLAGVDAVVNCVGVLQDGIRDDVQRVQFAGTAALFDACQRAGVRRVVHVSAIGAAPDGPSAFSRSKAAAEAHLKTLALDWVILRPALVLAPAVYGGTAMLRGIAAFPGCVPLVRAGARVQVIGIDDVVETVVRALAPDAPDKVIWDVAHPHVHTLAEIVIAMRGWLGFAPRHVLRLPDAIGKTVAAVADVIGWLGWRSPARTTALAQLTAGVLGDPSAWMAATGLRPQNLDEILAARPATIQDRWFSRLYLLKPLAILGLALTAIGAGAVAFHSYWTIAAGALGISTWVFARHVLTGLIYAALSVGIGLGILVRATSRCALVALLVLVLARTADYVVTTLQLRLVPSAIIFSEIPILLTALFVLAILDER
jgi:uncharacterized protein YbjT (DUF2867 family)